MKESIIKELRKKEGITQKQFSEKYGIPKRTIENWEEGKSKPPNYFIKLLKKEIK